MYPIQEADRAIKDLIETKDLLCEEMLLLIADSTGECRLDNEIVDTVSQLLTNRCKLMMNAVERYNLSRQLIEK